MKKIAFLLSIIPVLLFCVHSHGKSAATSVPDYDVKRAAGKIVIDGILNESDWQSANLIELQFPWDRQTGPRQLTKVKLLWDAEYLYIAYECMDSDIVARYSRHDDPVYEDDAVEVFINPNPTMNTYVGLEMNARGVLYDYLYAFPANLDKSFDVKSVQLKTKFNQALQFKNEQKSGWVLELAIPLSNFYRLAEGKKVSVGTIWSANINRWDGVEPDRRLSMWSDSLLELPNPHNPIVLVGFDLLSSRLLAGRQSEGAERSGAPDWVSRTFLQRTALREDERHGAMRNGRQSEGAERSGAPDWVSRTFATHCVA